jgi:predicted phage baseplate assembly protein
LPPALPSEVFQLDAESGQLRFGDGTHGKRPPRGASLRADYLYSVGAAGNVGIGSVSSGPALPAGFKVTNPVPTWGGADAETQTEAEKQIPRYLQHRDRLVTVKDFETITWRTPGVDIGRVEVIPAFHPKYSLAPGDAPGMVTLMVIPRYDADQPEAPIPDQNFLKAICDYINPRRLVTTELYLCGPSYLDVWVSIGIQAQPVASGSGGIAEVRERVKAAIRQFFSPLPPDADGMPVDDTIPPDSPYASGPRGWPLSKSVVSVEVATIAGRVPGVLAVNGVLLLRKGRKDDEATIKMGTLLSLPRLVGISVSIGDPLDRQQLGIPDGTAETGGGTGQEPGGQPPGGIRSVSVPIIPEECK